MSVSAREVRTWALRESAGARAAYPPPDAPARDHQNLAGGPSSREPDAAETQRLTCQPRLAPRASHGWAALAGHESKLREMVGRSCGLRRRAGGRKLGQRWRELLDGALEAAGDEGQAAGGVGVDPPQRAGPLRCLYVRYLGRRHVQRRAGA